MGDGLTIELSEEELEDLRSGETVEVTVEEDGDRRDFLEVIWKTQIEASEGAKDFFNEINARLDSK